MVRSALLVIVATLASSLLGFGREVVNARFFGTSADMDAFLAAATIPTILFGVFNGALLSALVPAFTDYVARDDSENAWRLASTVFNVLALALCLFAGLGWLFAPIYVPLIAHGFAPHEMAQTIVMTRWLMPSIVATSLAGVTSAMLNAQHRFSATAVQGVAINLVTIATVLVLYRRLGIYALVLGTALGLLAQLLVQLPAMFRYGLYRPVIDLHHPGLAKIGAMLGPIVVGGAAGQVAIFFDRYFASTLEPGYISGMNYALKLVGLPEQVFAAAVATVIFPLLASQFARQNRSGVRRSVLTGLRMVYFITVPSALGLWLLAQPIVATLFERGAFDARATAICASLLPYAAFGLVGAASCIVLSRCSFACQETRLTVAISIVSVALNVVLSLAWLPTLGARGLLLANSTSLWVQAALLFMLVWRLLGGLEWRTLALSAGRIVACSLVMAATLHYIAVDFSSEPHFSWRVAHLATEIAIASLVFLGAARLLGVEELGIVIEMIVRKFQSRTPSPPEAQEAPIA